MELKTKLSSILGEKRMTQSELSKKTGIRAATINEYYNDIWKSIKKKHIEEICKTLNCNIDDLFTLEKRHKHNFYNKKWKIL